MGFDNEIKHARRAFSRLLAGGALATFRKPTKARGFCMGFVYAEAYGSELPTLRHTQSPRERRSRGLPCCGEDEIRTRDTRICV